MYSYGPPHMAEQRQYDQLEPTYSRSVPIRDVALKTCQRRWTIGRSGERGSGISVLTARHDDIYIYIYIYCHPQTDCFVLSELFSVARHVGRLKLGSKPIQLYVYIYTPSHFIYIFLACEFSLFVFYIRTVTPHLLFCNCE